MGPSSEADLVDPEWARCGAEWLASTLLQGEGLPCHSMCKMWTRCGGGGDMGWTGELVVGDGDWDVEEAWY